MVTAVELLTLTPVRVVDGGPRIDQTSVVPDNGPKVTMFKPVPPVMAKLAVISCGLPKDAGAKEIREPAMISVKLAVCS